MVSAIIEKVNPTTGLNKIKIKITTDVIIAAE